MAYIRKLATGKWQAQVERNGIKSSKTFEAKRQAQAWALEVEAKAKRDRLGGAHTFGDLVQKYLVDVSAKKRGHPWEARRLQVMLANFGADTLLADIDTPQIAGWRDARLATVSGSTVLRESNLLRNVFLVAKNEWKWIPHNPFSGAKLPKENEPRHTVWGWKLIKRVLRAERTGKTHEMQLAFHIALRTGMRLQEVLAAPTGYDPATRVVTVRTKTEQAGRIPIGRIADRLLASARFTVGPNEGSVLFSRLCRELLIDGLTFHDARATALTHLARKVDVMTLAKISRHKNLNLLLRVYYRPSASDIARKI